MKTLKTFKQVFYLLLLFIFTSQIVLAEEVKPQVDSQGLPLTQKQITKLQHLFKSSSGSEFQLA